MRNVKNIILVASNELKMIVRGPSTFVVIALFLVISGLFFSAIVDSGAANNLSYLYRNLALVLMLIIPAFTMGAFVTEKNTGTLEYLQTTGITPFQLLIGKYISYGLVAFALVFMTLHLPFWLNIFTIVDSGRVIAGLIGLSLFALSVTAVGLFTSAFSKNQISASFIAFFLVVVLWCAESVLSLLTVVPSGYVRSISLFERFIPFSLGLVDYGDCLFFVNVAAIFLFLAWFVLYRRWGGSLRELLLLVLAGAAVFFSQSVGDVRLGRRDFTAESRFTLSEPMKSALSEIREPLNIMVFLRSGDPARTDVDGILREMVSFSPLVTYSLIDPYISTDVASKLNITKERTSVFTSGNRIIRSRGCNEVKLLSGIRRLLRTSTKEVCFLMGHGEKDFLSPDKDGIRMFVESLAAAGLSVAPLKLDTVDAKIPETCGSIVIVAPKTDLLEREGQLITDFVLNGGGLLIFAENSVGPVFASLLRTYGLGFENAVVIEPQSNLRGLATEPVIVDFRNHPAVRNLEGAVMRGVRPLKLYPVKGVRKEGLVYTSRNSWGETTLDSPSPVFDDKDIAGPLLVAAAAEKTVKWRNKAEEIIGRVLIVSDGELPVNASYNDLSNAELVLGAVEWVTGYGENVIMLPKGFLCRDLYLTSGQFRLLFIVSVLGVPFLALLCAGVAWVRYR